MSGLPPGVKHQLFGGGAKAQIQRPRNFGTSAFRAASTVRNESQGHAQGGGGLGRAFGATTGGGGSAQAQASGDPAVTGLGFDREPPSPSRFLAALGVGGGISEAGQKQKAISDEVQKFRSDYWGLKDRGATDQEAFGQAIKANGGLRVLGPIFQDHPDALRSMPALQDFLAGGKPGAVYGPVDKTGQQVAYDPNTGAALGAQRVPGYETPAGKPGRPLATSEGYMTPNADGTFTPTLGPNGEQLKTAAQGKADVGNGFTESDAGAGPQAPAKRPDGKPAQTWDPQSRQFVAAVPSTMDALDTIKQLAPQVAGLGRSLVAIAAGNYLGTNPAGQQMSQAFKVVNAASTMLSGRGYKAPMANWEALAGTPAMAPSATIAYATGMQKMVRSIGQQDVDQATQHAGERVPLPQAQQLMKAGIVPNGYQTQENLDKLPSGEGALWKARNGIAPTDADKAQLLSDAASGKFGSPKDPQNADPDLKLVRDMHQAELAQRAAKTQQATASSAAQAAQPAPKPTPPSGGAPTGNGPAGPGVQPAPGTEPGAQQPQQSTQQQNGQPPQAGQPQNQQPLGQEGQGNQPGQGTPPLSPSVSPNSPYGQAVNQSLMPQQAVPGTPVQGMPGTNGTTPQPPPNPLPGVSQTLTPQGGMPNPGTQAPVPSSTPLSSATMQLLQQNGVDTRSIAQPGDSTGAEAPIPPAGQ